MYSFWKKRATEKIMLTSVVTIPDFAMRYVSRYLGHDAIRIAILGSRCDMYRDTCLSGYSVLIFAHSFYD